MVDIIIDIETLGTTPGSPVIEIGACAINCRTGEITDNFSRRVKYLSTFEDHKEHVDSGIVRADMCKTFRWWTENPDRTEILRKIMRGGVRLREALYELSIWIEAVTLGDEGIRVWANGPAFDISILRHWFDHLGINLPWLCYSERCARTALEMANYERGSIGWIERGPRHRALNDARHEARKLYFSGALGEVSSIMLRLRQRYDTKARAVPS